MFLAIDAGGTSTRAAALHREGHVLGYGRSGSGNPTSAGIANAVDAIGAAAAQALAGRVPGEAATAVIAMAGEQTDAFRVQVSVRLGGLGCGTVILQPDLLGIFGSGTPRRDGYALIAGTGTVAARVRDGRLERVVGGRGWLLGDAGSGYWIGHQVARAVVAALDGQGPPTALTDSVLAVLGLESEAESAVGRESVLRQLVSTLYTRRPVQLSELAPLAFAVAGDPVAREILREAATALADLVATVQVSELTGPLVVGGSVAVRGFLAGPDHLRRIALPDADVIPVSDGVVGAAVLALRGAGIEVDEAIFEELRAEVGRRSE